MTDIEFHPDFAPAPATLFTAIDPLQIVAQATRIAEAIKPLIEKQHLFTRIHGSDHVQLEGWTLAGSLMPVGVFPITVRTWEIGEDAGYGACVEARTMAGAMVGRAEAVVMRDEEEGGKRKWFGRPSFQLISMAQTRASSKALRMPLGFIMKLAGYEATPAEEMEEAAARGETVTGGKGVREGWKDIQEQNTAHQRLNVFVANNGLGEWVGVFLDSKGYTRPLSKGQMADLRRAVDRELADREQMHESSRQPSDPGPTPAPPATGPGSDLTSEAGEQLARPSQGPRVGSPASDLNASEAGPGGNDATQAGREPPTTEAPTSPSPPSSPGDGGDHKSGRGPRHPGKVAASPAGPTDEATEQAAFDQKLAGQ